MKCITFECKSTAVWKLKVTQDYKKFMEANFCSDCADDVINNPNVEIVERILINAESKPHT